MTSFISDYNRAVKTFRRRPTRNLRASAQRVVNSAASQRTARSITGKDMRMLI
jgi:hypothetical protein